MCEEKFLKCQSHKIKKVFKFTSNLVKNNQLQITFVLDLFINYFFHKFKLNNIVDIVNFPLHPNPGNVS